MRLAGLVLAALLAAPAASALRHAAVSAAFLAEFLSEGGARALSAVTPPPTVEPLPAPGLAGAAPAVADLHLGARLGRAPGLVLVHGLAPEGKHDRRLRRAAALLARAGWAVAVPTLPGLTRLRLRPEDAGAVARAARALAARGHAPVGILAVSVGAGPAVIAAADPTVAPLTSAVLLLGGYARTTEVLRHVLTAGHVEETVVALFARANTELVGEAGRRLVDNRDPARFDALVAALPSETRTLLATLSPVERITGMRAPLFLVHGHADLAVPPSEALALATAARRANLPVRVVLVGAVAHVEGAPRAGLIDLVRLWAAFHAFRVTTHAA